MDHASSVLLVTAGLGFGCWLAAAAWLSRHWPETPWHSRLPRPFRISRLSFLMAAYLLADVVGMSVVRSVLPVSEDGDAATADLSDLRRTFIALAIAGLCRAVALPAIACGLKPRSLSFLGLRRLNAGSYVLFGIVQAAWWGPVAVVVSLVSRAIFHTHVHPAFELSTSQSPLDSVLLFVVAAVLAPFTEELVFRGFLQAWANQYLPASAAIAVSSLAFGFAHFATWPDPIPLTVLGIGLGVTYQRTRSLWAPVAFHAIFNGVMLGVARLVTA